MSKKLKSNHAAIQLANDAIVDVGQYQKVL